MNIRFGGQDMVLHHWGGLYWPSQNLLVVSDLHLEKGSHFARRGFFLPPYDSEETLVKLHALCNRYAPKRILLLGDSFHDANGYRRMNDKAKALFDDLRRYDPIWIRGNHDADFAPEGFEIRDDFILDAVRFVHEAAQDDGMPEISGHFHPKMDVHYKGSRISRRCFVEDGKRMIMPAMGAYAGGLSVTSAPIAALFKEAFTTHLLGENRVFSLGVSGAR